MRSAKAGSLQIWSHRLVAGVSIVIGTSRRYARNGKRHKKQSASKKAAVVSARVLGEHQKVGGQAALRPGSFICGCDLNFGYQRRNRSSRSSLRTLVLVCSKRWAPRSVHCICCFLTNRLLTTWLMADSTNVVLIVGGSLAFDSSVKSISWRFGKQKRFGVTNKSDSRAASEQLGKLQNKKESV